MRLSVWHVFIGLSLIQLAVLRGVASQESNVEGIAVDIRAEDVDPYMRMPYGRLIVRGDVFGTEYFRALFGAMIPCSSHVLVAATDEGAKACTLQREAEVVGRYVVARRGGCPFLTKVLYAQKAGAAGVIVVNSEGGLLRMPRANSSVHQPDSQAVIPAVMVTAREGEALLERLEASRELPVGTLVPSRAECEPSPVRKATQILLDYFAGARAEVEAATAMGQREELAAGRVVVCEDVGGVGGWSGNRSERPSFVGEAPCDAGWAEPMEFRPIVEPLPQGRPEHFAGGQAEMGGDDEAGGRIEALPAHFGGPMQGNAMEAVFADPAEGCEDLVGGGYRDKMVLFSRGTCPMVDKVRRAQRVGAKAVVIVNSGDTDDWVAKQVESNEPIASNPPQEALFGLGRPAPDRDVTDVHIPTVMISATDGKRIHRRLQSDVPTRLALRPVPPANGAWDEIRALLRKVISSTALASITASSPSSTSTSSEAQASILPRDPSNRRKVLEAMVEMHHPHTLAGSQLRWNALLAILKFAKLSDAVEELHDITTHASWTPSMGLVVSSPPSTSTTSATSSIDVADDQDPLSIFLLSQLPARHIRFGGANDAFHCRVDTGSLTVKITPYDPSSSFSTTARIKALLRERACLEKALFHNAAVTGAFIGQLKRELETDDAFDRAVAGLMKTFAASPNRAAYMADILEKAYAASLEQPHQDLRATVKDWLDNQ